MKNLLKTLILFTVMLTITNSCFAFTAGKIDKIIEKSQLDRTATVAISIKDATSGKTIYSRNQDKLLHPASTLKIPTTYFALNTLGYDYFFKTQFYTHDNDLYIKLGADPTLTTTQLQYAFKAIKEQNLNSFDNLYIDDSIVDKKEFSQGWMWDDDVNPYTPKVSAYNLDNNVIKVNVTAMADGTIKTSTTTKYPMSVFAHIKKSVGSSYYDINRYNWNNPELVEIYANSADMRPIYVPISSMRRYFIFNTEKILEDERISIQKTSYASKLVPEDAKQVYEISNSIKNTIAPILQDSNNLMSETIYKLAGGDKYGATGTDNLALAAMTEFYKDKDIKVENVLIKDGCGVSRNNLISADWMSDLLIKISKNKDFETFKQYMAQPGEGTLSERLFDLRGDVWLKTGSLANVSTIAGYIKSKDGNNYVISIFTQNFKENPKEIKKIEDNIINIIYNR